MMKTINCYPSELRFVSLKEDTAKRVKLVIQKVKLKENLINFKKFYNSNGKED